MVPHVQVWSALPYSWTQAHQHFLSGPAQFAGAAQPSYSGSSHHAMNHIVTPDLAAFGLVPEVAFAEHMGWAHKGFVAAFWALAFEVPA